MSHNQAPIALCLLLAGCCCPLNAWSNRSGGTSTWDPPVSSPPVVSPPSTPFGSNPSVPTPEPPVGLPNPGGTPTTTPGGGREPPASFGVASCDEYARAACACPNSAIRDNLCNAAHSAFNGWRAAVQAGAGGILASTCSQLVETTRQSCPAAAEESAPSIGIPNCDAYAQRACSCSNTMARPSMCSAARSSLQTFQRAIQAGGMTRDRANTSCQSLLDSARGACP